MSRSIDRIGSPEWSRPRKLPRPGPGKDRGGRASFQISPENRSKRLSLIVPGLVLLFNVFFKTDWSNLTSIVCSFFAAAFILLMHWYVVYPVLMFVASWVPNTKRLLSENKHLREQNQKLLKQAGQQSEYR